MTCSNCGQPAAPEATFCSTCGQRLGPAQAPPPPPAPKPPPVPGAKKASNVGRNLFLGCLLVVVLFVVLAVVAALFSAEKKPQPTAAEGKKTVPAPAGVASEGPSRASRAPEAKPIPSPTPEEPAEEESQSAFVKGSLSSVLGRNVAFEATDVADGAKSQVVLTKTGYLKAGPYQAQMSRFTSLYAECRGFEVRLQSYLPKHRSAVCSATGDFEAKAFVSVNEAPVPTLIREGELFFMDGREDIGYRYYSLVEKP